MTPQARIAEITNCLQAISQGWPFLMTEIQNRINTLTLQLISQDNEQTRGRIKQLRDLQDFPETLEQERKGIMSALSEMDAED